MKIKENKQPKITVNKLGEFLVAPPKRQRRILEQLKYPKDNAFGFTPYADVREAIKKYFINTFDESIISDAILVLENKLEEDEISDWQRSVNASSIEALEAVLDSENINTSLEYGEYKGENPKLVIHGVEISINPDLIINSTVRGKDCIGSVKIHISKNSKNNEEGSKYIAALLNDFTVNHLCADQKISKNEYSISYDVFNDTFVESPKAIKKRMGDIEAGCMNIRDIWESI